MKNFRPRTWNFRSGRLARIRIRGLPIEQRQVIAIVGRLRNHRNHFVLRRLGNVDGNVDFRAGALCLEEQKVFRPIHFSLHSGFAILGGDISQ
jgi:hypothetical protein